MRRAMCRTINPLTVYGKIEAQILIKITVSLPIVKTRGLYKMRFNVTNRPLNMI